MVTLFAVVNLGGDGVLWWTKNVVVAKVVVECSGDSGWGGVVVRPPQETIERRGLDSALAGSQGTRKTRRVRTHRNPRKDAHTPSS